MFIADDRLSVIEQLADELVAAAGVVKPPVEAGVVARSIGLTLAWDEHQSGRARCVRLSRRGSGAGAVLLKPDPRPERQQWAIAHEVGEACSLQVFERLAGEALGLPAAREEIANLLAARLLLPGCWFGPDAQRLNFDLPRLKSLYCTASHELIARRMLDLPAPAILSIFDQGRLTFRKRSGHLPAPPVCAAERRAQQRAHYTGAVQVVRDCDLHIHAWPIHEPQWKREIMRTACCGDYVHSGG